MHELSSYSAHATSWFCFRGMDCQTDDWRRSCLFSLHTLVLKTARAPTAVGCPNNRIPMLLESRQHRNATNYGDGDGINMMIMTTSLIWDHLLLFLLVFRPLPKIVGHCDQVLSYCEMLHNVDGLVRWTINICVRTLWTSFIDVKRGSNLLVFAVGYCVFRGLTTRSISVGIVVVGSSSFAGKACVGKSICKHGLYAKIATITYYALIGMGQKRCTTNCVPYALGIRTRGNVQYDDSVSDMSNICFQVVTEIFQVGRIQRSWT